ncbi:DUF6300 family protein [Streptomyces sp. NPDC002044]|uniref:DUF6300 family protein n=1 Tax=Streptomyces sp. NPDC002044 TaxID=3154662 RepID=UPI00332B6FDB
MTSAEREIEILLTDPPECGRCGRGCLLSARVPHRWQNESGRDVVGLRQVVLCQVCDRGRPGADELMALFAVDGQVGLANMEAFGVLVDNWLDEAEQKAVDLDHLEREQELWRRGEL